MLLTNHVLTGALIGLTVRDPVLVAPAAFAAHFAMDMIPHFGVPGATFLRGIGRRIGFIDSFSALGIYLLLLYLFPGEWIPLTVGVFFCALPDLFYLAEIFWGKTILPPLRRLHSRNQWSETVPGIAVEVVWAAAIAWFIGQQ